MKYLDSARMALEKALLLAPAAAETWNAAGVIELAKGDLDAAARYYRKAMEINPNYEAPILNLSSIYRNKGQLDEAIPLMKQAISLNPLSLLGYQYLSATYYGKGALDEATIFAKQALSLDPLSVGLQRNLTFYYISLGMYGHAEATLQQALKLDEMNFDLLIYAAYLHIMAGEPERARTYLDRLMALSESDKRVYAYAAEHALVLKDYPLAKAWITKAMEQEGFEDIQYFGPEVLGYLLWQEGKPDSARALLDPHRKHLEQKLEKDPKNMSDLCGLALNHAIRGNKAEAIGYLERLVDAGDTRPAPEYMLNPRLAGLLGEPRFKALMQRIEKRTETQRLNVLAQERKLERPKKQ